MGYSPFSRSSSTRAAAGCRAPCDPIPTSFAIKHVWPGLPRELVERRWNQVGGRSAASRSATKCKVGKTWGKTGYILAEIVYPNCTTFEGRKLILFEGVTLNWLKRQTSIDPHFIEDGHIIARFVPTKEGRRLAMRLMT